MLDFDGTLVDTMGGFAQVASKVLNRYFGTPVEVARRQYIETSGIPFRQQVELLHPLDPRNDAAAAEFESLKLEGFFNERFSEEAKEAVRRLRGRGKRVVVSSNNFQHLVDAFCKREPDVQFDLILGAREGFYKGPDHFRYIERAFSCPRDAMCFVGDSLKDGERAQGYGVPFIAKAGTFTKKEFQDRFPSVVVIESLLELEEIIE